MGQSNPDEKILSYNDVVLRRSDLDILSGPFFLNDRIIEFYFSFLSSSHPSQQILLVPPSISFWIMNCPLAEGLKEFLEPLCFPSKDLIIFPVNDNNDVNEAEGGFHWSLLAFERKSNVFVHHDSCGGMNARHAKRLYKAVVGFVSDSNSASNSCPRYLECIDSPQQRNGYDCGLYVIAIAKVICLWYGSDEGNNEYKDKEELWFSAAKKQVTPHVVSGMRDEILGLIRGFMDMK
ncbi:hypothetical protein FNV43_RR05516 [Rhamnella rubrinervis]|uniref:Ubiquitin-like protease family profile domain-containing protein n=1 Tax=Rhamnella rubrinervis TaxID=2594499 RepID=A0A8K0HP50_9ROSA|nr:hypothetical protein FNV43_RR05516 [Rhamnella rubrinervis]